MSRYVGQNIYFSVITNDSSNEFTYQWELDGDPIPSATDSTLSLSEVSLGQAGDYTVVVTSGAGSTTSNIATLTVTPVAVNDLFINAALLAGQTVSASATNTGAGKEAGEPLHAGDSGGSSLWWSWTAPASGAVVVDSSGSTMDTLVAVYTGTTVDSLNEVASGRRAVPSAALENPAPSFASFVAIEGTTYRIAVDGEAGFSGDVELRLSYTYNFSTLAGQANVLGGDNGNGSDASFGQPHELAFDSNGNLYVADSWNHVIRKITPLGDVSVFAGLMNSAGSADDTGGDARFNYPTGLAIDSNDNLFVADHSNHTIRKITPAGVVSTFAGVAGSSGGVNDTGASARFTTPWRLAIDAADNLYVTENGRYWVRKITPSAVVSTLAGQAGTSGSTNDTGTAALFSSPSSMTCDATGNLFVCDGNTLRKVTPAGVVSTIAGVAGDRDYIDGAASVVRLDGARSIAVRADGSVLFADSEAIRMLTSDGSVVTLVGGDLDSSECINGTGREVRFRGLNQMALSEEGKLYTTEMSGHLVRCGVLSSLPAVPSITLQPQSIRVIAGSDVTLTSRAVGNPLPSYQWKKNGADIPGEVLTNVELSNAQPVDSGNYTFVATNTEGFTVSESAEVEILPLPVNDDFTGSTVVSGDAVELSAYNYAATSEPGEPDHGGAAAENSVWFSWTAPGSGRVTIDTLGSDFETRLAAYLGNSVDTLSLLEEDVSGGEKSFSRVYVNVSAGDVVHIAVDGIADATGEIQLSVNYSWTFDLYSGGFASTGSADGSLTDARYNFPSAVASDSSGNLYIADRNNHVIRKVTPSGSVSTLAGSAGLTGAVDDTGSLARFNTPYGLTVDAVGNVYVADTGNAVIRKVTPAGVVSTLAGLAGAFGSADGDGGAARFGLPVGIAVNESGDLYVTDYSNQLIRKVTAAGVVTTFAGELNSSGGVSRFTTPWGVAIDATGNVYVSDRSNIRKITPQGVPSLFAGSLNGVTGHLDGSGEAARFDTPAGMAFDAAGDLYVADQGNHCIRKISANGHVRTVGGADERRGYLDGVGEIASFAYPVGVAFGQNGDLFIADSQNQLIRSGSQLIARVQTITFNPLADVLYSASPITLAATASSGLLVTFELVSGPASVNGDQLTLTGEGIVTIRANQLGDSGYLAAVPVERSFTVHGFSAWQQNVFTPTQLSDPLISGWDADYDGDGLSTLLEYALGLDPTQPEFVDLPASEVTASNLILTYTRPTNRADVNYVVKVSSGLSTWSATGVVHELISTVDEVETWRATYPRGGASELFIRLEVNQ